MVVVTTTGATAAAALAMVDVTAMENGMKPVGHIREMIVVTAVARTAADRAAIAGAVVATATSRSPRTTAGRNLLETLMTTVEVAETATETTAAEEVVAMTEMEAATVAEGEADAIRRTGQSRLRGTRESKLSSLARGRWPVAESTLTGTRISRLKRLATMSQPALSPLPRWSSRP